MSVIHKLTLWQQVYYRLRQFFRGLLAHVDEAELQSIQPLLPVQAFALFQRLPIDAQRHSLNVLHDLQQQDAVHPDLAAAALLHDIGKLAAEDAGTRIGLWLRAPLVLLNALAPRVYERLQSDNPQTGWRYALYVYQAHPQIGAEWTRQAGCNELTCWLIEQHQTQHILDTNEDQSLLALLQWADAKN